MDTTSERRLRYTWQKDSRQGIICEMSLASLWLLMSDVIDVLSGARLLWLVVLASFAGSPPFLPPTGIPQILILASAFHLRPSCRNTTDLVGHTRIYLVYGVFLKILAAGFALFHGVVNKAQATKRSKNSLLFLSRQFRIDRGAITPSLHALCHFALSIWIMRVEL